MRRTQREGHTHVDNLQLRRDLWIREAFHPGQSVLIAVKERGKREGGTFILFYANVRRTG